MNVILIDDEKHALDILDFHLNTLFEDVFIKGKFQNAANALLYLNSNAVDLIFMDVSMPGLTGLETAAILNKNETPIIFVTALVSHAIDAVKLNIFDYLLKPIEESELLRVYEKFKTHKKSVRNSKIIEFSISNRHIISNEESVLYVRSEGNYSTIFFTDRKELLITKNMKKMITEYFDETIFFRCHRSYLVNTTHVIEFNNHEVILTGDIRVPLARNKSQELKMLIRR